MTSEDNEDSEVLLDRAFKQERSGDFDAAISIYEQLAASGSEHATYARKSIERLTEYKKLAYMPNNKTITARPKVDSEQKIDNKESKSETTELTTPSIFLSYRRKDSAAMAGRIYDRLESHYGRNCVFMDIDAIPIGVDFREHIEESLKTIRVMLVLIGDSWLDDADESGRRLDEPNDYVRLEIEAALKMKIPVVPVLVGDAPVPRPDKLPESLSAIAYRNAVKVDTALDFRNHVDRLITGLDRIFREAHKRPDR